MRRFRSLLAMMVITLRMDIITHGQVPAIPPTGVRTDEFGENLQLNQELENTTLYEGDPTYLKCEITGSPLPTYKWYKNDAPIGQGVPRISSKTTLWGSMLSIKNLQVKDAGRYKCVGSNSFSETLTEGYLTVLTGVNPNRSRTKMHNDLDPDSEAIDPEVDIKPLYPEFPGHKQHLNEESPKKQKNEEGDIKKPEDHQGFCQPYMGGACSKYLANQSILVLDTNYQSMHEEWIKGLLASLDKVDEISFQCKQFLAPIVCLTTFSTCHLSDVEVSRKSPVRTSRTRKLCREECDLVRSVHCREEFSDENLVKWSFPPSILEKFKYENVNKILDAAKCNDMNTQKGGACYVVNIPSVPPYDDSKCYTDDGHSYRGVVRKTKSKTACLRWSDIGTFYEQNQFNREPMDHNLCRNPDRSMSAPWCYVEAEVGHAKELCAMEPCGDQRTSYHKSLLVGVPCAVLIAIIATVVVCTKMRREGQKKRKSTATEEPLSNHQQPQQQANVQLKSLLGRHSFQSSNTPPYIAPGNISLNYELFQQPYGKVYRGEILSFSAPIGGPVVPAIFRTLDPNVSAKLQLEFWKEIDKVCDFRHPNITAVLGLNKTSQPNFVAFEASSYGDLNEYLKSNSEVVKCQPTENFTIARASVLPHAVLVSIAVQVASALEFLHSKNFIHSELSSYNVLVCENGVVKISLVLPGSGPNYFPAPQGRSIPLRWSPPEVLLSLTFSDKSDVWSFGVLLWEIYSCASVPYGFLSDIEVAEAIKSFRILPCPNQCPADMYALIVQCWHKVPSSRPTAGELHDQLRQSWTELNRAPSMNPSLVSNQSHENMNHNNSCDNQPLPKQQLTSTRLLSSHSSSPSQKSSPASSACNYKQAPVNDFATSSSVGKKCYFNNEVYTEQIV